MKEPLKVRIFLSWTHEDAALKRALLKDLLPALGMSREIIFEWWEDSHLTCGEELTTTIISRLGEADFGLPLLSTRYFGSAYVREYELPRFAGPEADKPALPVALSPLPGFGSEWNMEGLESHVVFTQAGRSYAELSGARRTKFANDLAGAIRRRVLSLDGYRRLQP